MKVDFFIIADYANLSQEQKLNVMGVFDQIFASSFPARHPTMHLVLRLSPEMGEYDQDRQMTIKLVDPNDSEILSLTAPIKIPAIQAGRRPKVNVIIELKDVTFQKEGLYGFILLIDKDHKDETYIEVVKLDVVNNG